MARLGLSDVQTLVTANNCSKILSDEFIVCLIWKECGFEPRKNTGSSASGMMQMTIGAVAEVNKLSTVAKAPFTYQDMNDYAKNIQCATLYLDIRIKWAKGDVKAGVNGYGTGMGYATNIIACEACLKTAIGGANCLLMIHA